ncbi:Glycosyl transferase, group 1 [Sulfurimonas denitrificans DSM 1251]|uniref:Glycosyl transferase, group 1 n=1 Tax=Sulfurimonas denitrificans (strain ATCC 33889 / DSM 1251) TaxID=326298 RepID=Q30PS4_SULDN|nr:glycosyltransferase family 1 protein [Sulfurimonas denitrificans]ABB45007.1 Glycosyl transferase, group 1 [Sulfurimonas denitrificans DSM 1251]
MTIYLDITQLNKSRANTGIQRVVKEFLKRALENRENIFYKIISYNADINSMELLQNSEIREFLTDIQNYTFVKKTTIDIFSIKPTEPTILFELDATWNAPLNRALLYPILKENGFLIFNFIYDLTPIILPNFANEITAQNFPTFLNALYQHSDMVFCDSYSAKNDFLHYKESLNITREIKTEVVALGADFFKINTPLENHYIKRLLKKKYILFVGTLEPRKNQENVLDAFEILAKTHPDLNLIFIGKQGWKIEHLIQKIETHKLKDKQLFWLNDIDDNTLSHFYQNAFLVTYLSKYEGYGLPITEALQHANIVITSKNSSMHEVGQDFVHYILHDSTEELIETILFYYNNPTLYNQRRKHIKQNFKTKTWDMFYETIHPFFSEF